MLLNLSINCSFSVSLQTHKGSRNIAVDKRVKDTGCQYFN